MILYLRVVEGVEGVLVLLEGLQGEAEVDVWAQCLEGHQAGSQQEALEGNEYKRLKWSDLSEEQLYTICNCIQKNNATTQSIHCVRTCLSVSDQRQD